MNNRIDAERKSSRQRRRLRAAISDPHANAPETTVEPSSSRPRLWLVLLLCLAGSAVVSFVVFKSLIEPTVPPELVGTWEVTTGPLHGATLDFRPDGTAVAILYKHGKKETTHSSARVEDKTLFLTTRDDASGKEDTVTQTIVELTAEELVLRDEDLITYHMKRVRNGSR
jgi:uncharacterized protein (TIGR03066 family)